MKKNMEELGEVQLYYIDNNTILLTYLILVILAAMQYAAYYDLYWEIINTNSILYVFFWIIDVVFQLFIVVATIYGALKVNTESKNRIIFCSVLFSLFLGLGAVALNKNRCGSFFNKK